MYTSTRCRFAGESEVGDLGWKESVEGNRQDYGMQKTGSTDGGGMGWSAVDQSLLTVPEVQVMETET